MAIFHPPPPPFVGGAQPYAPSLKVVQGHSEQPPYTRAWLPSVVQSWYDRDLVFVPENYAPPAIVEAPIVGRRTRLGLYGATRQPYGSFRGRVAAGHAAYTRPWLATVLENWSSRASYAQFAPESQQRPKFVHPEPIAQVDQPIPYDRRWLDGVVKSWEFRTPETHPVPRMIQEGIAVPVVVAGPIEGAGWGGWPNEDGRGTDGRGVNEDDVVAWLKSLFPKPSVAKSARAAKHAAKQPAPVLAEAREWVAQHNPRELAVLLHETAVLHDLAVARHDYTSALQAFHQQAQAEAQARARQIIAAYVRRRRDDEEALKLILDLI